MASDNRIIDLTINLNTSRFSQRSFSSVMVLSVNNYMDKAVSTVNQLTDLPSVASGSPLYKAVNIAFAQDKPLGYVNIGRLIPTKTTLTLPAELEAGKSYGVFIAGQPCMFMATSESTMADATSSLVTAISALLPNCTVTAENNVVSIADSNSEGFIIDAKQNVSVDFEIVGDFTAQLNNILKKSDFFGFAMADNKTTANIHTLALFAEASKRQFFVSVGEADIKNDVAGNILEQLKNLSYDYTNFMFSESDFADVAFMCQGYSVPVGSDNFANMSLAGVAPSDLTENEYQAITHNNGNTYETIHNVNMTQNGVSVSGEYIDIIRDSCNLYDDVLTSLMQMVNNKKIPYTDNGILMVTESIASVLDDYVANGFLAEEETDEDGNVNRSYIVQAPKASSVDSNTKASRTLKSVTFQGRLAGAINHMVIVGNVSYDNINSGAIAVSAYLR